MTTRPIRAAKTKDDQVADLMRKTLENGATPGEEVSAVQLAHMVVRQNGLDLDAFKAALAKIGDPPRYELTADGFLVPAAALPTVVEMPNAAPRAGAPSDNPREAPAAAAHTTAEGRCRESPMGRHRWERHMRGTMPTGLLYCIHCGLTREPPANPRGTRHR